jgi:hypothetical protein
MPGSRIAMASPTTIANEISWAAENLQTVLTTHHGVLRGTMEAALAEAQGAELIAPGEAASHLSSMEQAAAALSNNEQVVVTQLQQLRNINAQAAGQLSNALRPLLQLVRQRIDLMQQVRNLALELEMLHPERLESTPVVAGPREVASLISSQLRSMAGPLRAQGIALVPGGLTVQAWVQNVLQQVRQLPVNMAQATAQVSALMVGVRTALQAAASSATPVLLRVFGAALDVLLSIGGSLITIPLIIGPLPQPGGRPPDEA